MTKKIKNTNCKCGQPKMVLTRRKTGEQYLWSYCSDCEAERQAKRRKVKSEPNLSDLEGSISKTPYKNMLKAGFNTPKAIKKGIENGELGKVRDMSAKALDQIKAWLN